MNVFSVERNHADPCAFEVSDGVCLCFNVWAASCRVWRLTNSVEGNVKHHLFDFTEASETIECAAVFYFSAQTSPRPLPLVLLDRQTLDTVCAHM